MSIDACAEKVRTGDPDRFLSALVAPADLRSRLMVLYAFNLEIARAPWVSNEPMINEMRLQFWADTVDEIAAGKPARAHEVAEPLADLINKANLPCDILGQMVQARRFDVHKDPHESVSALAEYALATSGNLMWCAAVALGATPENRQTVMSFGQAVGIANLMRSYAHLVGLHHEPLADASDAELRGLAANALEMLKSARKKRAIIPAVCKAALLAGWQADAVLKIVLADPSKVKSGQLDLPEFSRRARLLYRTSTGRW